MRRGRLAVAIIGMTTVALLVGPVFATKDDRRPSVLSDQLRKVGSAQRGGEEVGLWVAPTSAGGRCIFLHAATAESPVPTERGNRGGECEIGASHRQKLPIQAAVSWSRDSDGGYDVMVDGRVAPEAGITRLELVSAAGSQTLSLTDGYFLAALPSTKSADDVSTNGVSPLLVGYDRRGDQIASLDLAAQVAATTAP